jgi:hypothetical protein
VSDMSMFKDFEQKTDKLDSEFTLRIPEVAKKGMDKLDTSRKKVLNKYMMDLIDRFLDAEAYATRRGRYLTTEE